MLTALTIVLLFAAAWAVARLSALVARRVMVWHDRRNHAPSGDLRAKIIELKRRETTVAVIRTGIGYIAFLAAIVLAAAQVTGGFDRLTAVAGASFVLILVGFALQRVLIDTSPASACSWSAGTRSATRSPFRRWSSRESSQTSLSAGRSCGPSTAR
jgi:small-conductance mechanosensitive channel